MRDSLCRVLAFAAIMAPAAVASAEPLPVANTGSAWLGLSWRDRGPIVMTGTVSPQVMEGFAREIARSGRDVVIASPESRDQAAGTGLCKIHRAAAVIIVRDLTGAVVGDLWACADPVATTPRKTLLWQPAPALTPQAKWAQKGAVTGLGMLIVGLAWSFGVGIHNFGCGSSALLGGTGRDCERKSQLWPRMTMGVGAGLAITSLFVSFDESENRRLHLTPVAAPGTGGMALAGRF